MIIVVGMAFEARIAAGAGVSVIAAAMAGILVKLLLVRLPIRAPAQMAAVVSSALA